MLDLARVLEIEPDGYVVSAWALLTPSRKHPYWRLLLRIQFERPVRCSFACASTSAISRATHSARRCRSSSPRTGSLSPSTARPSQDRPLVWVAAPAARECVFEVLAAVGLA